jgi:hypothetical protein
MTHDKRRAAADRAYGDAANQKGERTFNKRKASLLVGRRKAFL